MKSLQKKLLESGNASRAGLIWLALAGFFLGSALCPFNPPVDDRPNSVKEGKKMNTTSESRTNIENTHVNASASTSPEIETATFALG